MSQEKLNILLVGKGRLGGAIEQELFRRGHAVCGIVTAEIGAEGKDEKGRSLAEALDALRPDLAFEATCPNAAKANVTTLLQASVPVVCGTTGWNPEELAGLAEKQKTPFLHAANFSIGIAVMKRAAEEAARRLRPFQEFEPAMLERHHNQKVDTPSGTAAMLASAVANANGRESIPVVSLRQGNAPGDHHVYFEGQEETIEITHRARSVRIFAAGAVRAAQWLVQERPVGLISFDQFLEKVLA